MKKILLFTACAMLFACSTLRNFDTSGFTTDEFTVYLNNKPMAILKGVEFAWDDRKLVKEMTFELVDGDNNDKVVNLIAFLHDHYKDYEIEVEIPIEKYRDLNK
ncbi:MAG: hypothetical protein ACK45H_11485 [Bacteroidota bacterium]|jgi:hypothetical protein